MTGDFVSVVRRFHRRSELLGSRGEELAEVEGKTDKSPCALNRGF